MSNYAPQTLPTGTMRAAEQRGEEKGRQRMVGPAQHAIQLGQYIRREQGMQGVRRYMASICEFLPEGELMALCEAMGVPPSQIKRRQEAPPEKQEAPQQPQANPNNQMNQMQMMQMLSQLMNMGGMGNAAAGNANPAGGLGGLGGMNPALLAQMLGGMGGMGGAS